MCIILSVFPFQNDRVEVSRKTKIGTIEVVRQAYTYIGEEMVTIGDTHFDQANKKDTGAVTKGQYTMSTTKKGKVIESRDRRQQWAKIWQPGTELGRLSVVYRMAHTLQVQHLWSRYLTSVLEGVL